MEGEVRLGAPFPQKGAPSSKNQTASLYFDALNNEGASFFDDAVVELSRDVLDECRATLMLSFRFLDEALWRLPYEPESILSALAVDGRALYFNPMPLILEYREAPESLVRDLLHSTLHCVFRQPLDSKHEGAFSWSLACDMVVERIVLDMCGLRFAVARDDERRRVLERFERALGALNTGKLYYAFEAILHGPDELAAPAIAKLEASFGEQLSTNRLYDFYDLFRRDTHALWLVQNDSEGKGAGAQGQRPDVPRASDAADDAPSTSSALQSMSESQLEELADQWEQVCERLRTGAETSFSQGADAGSLREHLKLAGRKAVSYADFLRKFSIMREEMQVNEDEFDYVFYTYGLARYGNMPLVEPLEYREAKRVRDFVIAIDTSGSCSGALVRRFLESTCEILLENQGFDAGVNVHVVQCDARIQSDTVISSKRDVEEMMEGFVLRGFGGTDFRPVFDYVGSLVEQGAFRDLQGLVYFTDGQGIYPKRRPPYDVAFVFVGEENDDVPVPPWACRVLIGEEEVRLL